MITVQIPKNYSITVGGYYYNPYYISTFIPGQELLTPSSKRVLLSLSWGGGMFEQASAQIQVFEPIPAIESMPPFGGIWEIKVNYNTVFRGFADNVRKDRSFGGNVYTFTLKSVLSAWDVLLTNTSYGDFGSGASYQFSPATMGNYISYLINDVRYLSGVPYNGPYPLSNSISFTYLYQDGVLSVTNSTYLAEIQKACQNIGYVIFAEPTGWIRIIDPLVPAGGVILTSSYHASELIDASFTTNMSSIPATVLVADDIAGVGVAYGYKNAGASFDSRNYDITKLNNIVFASTTGINPSQLPTIAQQIFNISRQASQKLTFRIATMLSAQEVLGYLVGWVDSAGNYYEYIIQKYTTTITPQELYTEIEARPR